MCSRQLQGLRDSQRSFEDRETKIIAVVPHEVQRVRVWQDAAGEDLPVLADGGFKVSSQYGVAFQMRVHTDTSNTPATFLIDKAGMIRLAHIGQGPKNFHDRLDVEQIIAQIDSWSHP